MSSGRAADRGVPASGLSPRLYATVRFLLRPLLRVWFRMRIESAEHIPDSGPAIIAPNHKSFLDAFFVAIATRRHVRYMAKSELFRGPLGWLFLRLGAFPVRRGESDADAMAMARTLLDEGHLLVIFPEGTRVEERDVLGSPHHGAGRLALETGAPIVPAAVVGTHRLWLGPIPKPRRVQVAFSAPIDPRRFAGDPAGLGKLVDQELWPAVVDGYSRALTRPGLILAGLAALGVGGRLLGRWLARRETRVTGIMQPRKVRRRQRREGRRAQLWRFWKPARPRARRAFPRLGSRKK